jgi:hypothetical protein
MYAAMATFNVNTTHLITCRWRISEYTSQGKYMLPESSANHSAHSRSYPQAESFGETHHGVDHGRPGEHPQMLVCRFTCRSHEQVRQSPSRRDMQKSNELFGEGIQILVHQPEKPQPQKQNQQPLSGFKDHYRAQRQRFGGRSMHFTTTVPARRYGVAVQSLSSVECSAQSLSVKLCTSLAGAQRPPCCLALATRFRGSRSQSFRTAWLGMSSHSHALAKSDSPGREKYAGSSNASTLLK